MAHLTGLFRRGSTYYLRVVLPQSHPLAQQHANGHIVRSLGAGSHRSAMLRGTLLRAQILGGHALPAATPVQSVTAATMPEVVPVFLRDVYNCWVKSKPLTPDSIAACGRSLALFEEQTGNPDLPQLKRAQGDAFGAWLQTLPTTSKTARDRLNWVKTLLKYAAQELEVLPKSPWVGLDIKSRTTAKRQPWAEEHLKTLFGHDIWRRGELPTDKKAGGIAAYWIPLLALYTGARCSELCQLNVCDIVVTGHTPTIRITD
jgi:hypothetical protein